jgi:hypothetical protein
MPTQDISPIYVPPLMNGLGARAPIMQAKTADYTVVASDSGTVFHTTGATAAVNFTLPAINTGPWHFLFINGADQNLTVTSATADTIVTYGDLNADSVAFSTSSEKIGGAIEVWCDGTTLFVLARPASIYQTITIATS